MLKEIKSFQYFSKKFCSIKQLLSLSFACPKESNQRKGHRDEIVLLSSKMFLFFPATLNRFGQGLHIYQILRSKLCGLLTASHPTLQQKHLRTFK